MASFILKVLQFFKLRDRLENKGDNDRLNVNINKSLNKASDKHGALEKALAEDTDDIKNEESRESKEEVKVNNTLRLSNYVANNNDQQATVETDANVDDRMDSDTDVNGDYKKVEIDSDMENNDQVELLSEVEVYVDKDTTFSRKKTNNNHVTTFLDEDVNDNKATNSLEEDNQLATIFDENSNDNKMAEIIQCDCTDGQLDEYLDKDSPDNQVATVLDEDGDGYQGATVLAKNDNDDQEVTILYKDNKDTMVATVLDDMVANDLVEGDNADREATQLDKEFIADNVATEIAEDVIEDLLTTVLDEEVIAEQVGTVSDEEVIAEQVRTVSDDEIIAEQVTTVSDEDVIADQVTTLSVEEIIADQVITVSDEEIIADQVKKVSDEEVIAYQVTTVSDKEIITNQVTTVSDEEIIAEQVTTVSDGEIIEEQVTIVSDEDIIAYQVITVSNEEIIADQVTTVSDEEVIADQVTKVSDEKVIAKQVTTVSDEEVIAEQVGTVSDEEVIAYQVETVSDEEFIADQAVALSDADFLGNEVVTLSDEEIKDLAKFDTVDCHHDLIATDDVAESEENVIEEALRDVDNSQKCNDTIATDQAGIEAHGLFEDITESREEEHLPDLLDKTQDGMSGALNGEVFPEYGRKIDEILDFVKRLDTEALVGREEGVGKQSEPGVAQTMGHTIQIVGNTISGSGNDPPISGNNSSNDSVHNSDGGLSLNLTICPNVNTSQNIATNQNIGSVPVVGPESDVRAGPLYNQQAINQVILSPLTSSDSGYKPSSSNDKDSQSPSSAPSNDGFSAYQSIDEQEIDSSIRPPLRKQYEDSKNESNLHCNVVCLGAKLAAEKRTSDRIIVIVDMSPSIDTALKITSKDGHPVEVTSLAIVKSAIKEIIGKNTDQAKTKTGLMTFDNRIVIHCKEKPLILETNKLNEEYLQRVGEQLDVEQWFSTDIECLTDITHSVKPEKDSKIRKPQEDSNVAEPEKIESEEYSCMKQEEFSNLLSAIRVALEINQEQIGSVILLFTDIARDNLFEVSQTYGEDVLNEIDKLASEKGQTIAIISFEQCQITEKDKCEKEKFKSQTDILTPLIERIKTLMIPGNTERKTLQLQQKTYAQLLMELTNVRFEEDYLETVLIKQCADELPLDFRLDIQSSQDSSERLDQVQFSINWDLFVYETVENPLRKVIQKLEKAIEDLGSHREHCSDLSETAKEDLKSSLNTHDAVRELLDELGELLKIMEGHNSDFGTSLTRICETNEVVFSDFKENFCSLVVTLENIVQTIENKMITLGVYSSESIEVNNGKLAFEISNLRETEQKFESKLEQLRETEQKLEGKLEKLEKLMMFSLSESSLAQQSSFMNFGSYFILQEEDGEQDL